MKNYQSQLNPGSYYHIYNRSVGSGKLFRNEGNYEYFLNKFNEHVRPIVDVYSYCLLPTHFHFLLKIKETIEIIEFLKSKEENFEKNISSDEKSVSLLVSKQFSNLFNGYTKALNKQQKRHGALFSRPFNRIEVNDESYLRKLVHYIHNNPSEADYCSAPEKWKWSSYNEIVSSKESFVSSNEVLAMFNGIDNFKFVHSQPYSEN